MIRNLELSDLTILEKNNTIPNLFNGPFKLIRAIEKDEKLIAAFWVRVTVEPSLIFTENLSNLQIARALDETIKFLFCKVPERLGISDSFIVFEKCFNEYYIEYLKRHYSSEKMSFEEMSKVLRLRRDDAK